MEQAPERIEEDQPQSAAPEQTAAPEQSASLPPWDAEVADRFQKTFPLLDPEQIRTKYEHARSLAESRAYYASPETQSSMGMEHWMRSADPATPIRSAIENTDYQAAKERYGRSEAGGTDFNTIAAYEQRQKMDAERSRTAKIAGAVAGLPAIGLKGMLPGGLLGIFAEQSAEGATARAVEQGGQFYEPKNLAPATVMAGVQALILGKAGALTKGIANPVGRFAAGVGAGSTEMEGARALGDVMNQYLPEGFQTKTRYGYLGDLKDGKFGEAAQKAITDVLTVSTFQALHGNPQEAKKTVDEAVKTLDEHARKGQPISKAADVVGEQATKAKEAITGVADATQDFLKSQGVEPPKPAPPMAPPVPPREAATALEGQLRQAQAELVDAKKFEAGELGNKNMGLAHNHQIAQETRREWESRVKDLQRKTDDARVAAAASEATVKPPEVAPSGEVAEKSGEVALPVEAKPTAVGDRAYHVADYKNPGNSVEAAMGILDRKGSFPKDGLWNWNGPDPLTMAENALPPAGVAFMVDKNSTKATMEPRGKDILFAPRSSHSVAYDPGFKSVIYGGKETDANYQRLREKVNEINKERADVSLMKEAGHEGALPPVKLETIAEHKGQEAKAPEIPRDMERTRAMLKQALVMSNAEGYDPAKLKQGFDSIEKAKGGAAADAWLDNRIKVLRQERVDREVQAKEEAIREAGVQRQTSDQTKQAVKDMMGQAGLSEVEKHVLVERLVGEHRGHAEIATDPIAEGYKGGRSTIKAIEKRALKKIGYEGSIEDLWKEAGDDMEGKLRELLPNLDTKGLESNPQGVAKKFDVAVSAEDARNTRWAKYLKELKDNAGQYTAEQLSAIDAEISRRYAQGGHPPGYEKPARVGAKPEREPDLPASLQPRPTGELSQNPPSGPESPTAQNEGDQGLGGSANAGKSEAAGNELNDPFHPANLAASAKAIRSEDAENVQRHNELLREARRGLSEFGSEYKFIGTEKFEDANDVKGLDEVAHDLKEKHPELFPDDNRNPDDVLFDLLKKGNRQPLTAKEAMREARGLAYVQRKQAAVQEANQALKQEGLSSATPADIGNAEGQAERELAEEARNAAAERDANPSGPTDIPFDNQFRREPGAAEPITGPSLIDSPGPIGGAFRRGLTDFAADEAGSLDLNKVKDFADDAKDRFVAGVKAVSMAVRSFGHEMYPITGEHSPATQDKMATFATSRQQANRAKPYFIDKVLGEHVTPEQSKLWWTTLQETRLRYAAQEATARGDTEGAQRASRTFVGEKDSALKDEATYAATLKDPDFLKAVENYKSDFVPIAEEFYKQAAGIDAADSIDSLTQIPGLPVPFKAIREGDSGGTPLGSAKGSLAAQKLRKLGATREAKFSAEKYETDFREMLGYIIDSRIETANKHEMFRTAVSEGQAKWSAPGPERLTGEDGTFRKMPDVNPPKGTQENEKGQTSLYVNEAIWHEMKNALNMNEPGPGTQMVRKATNFFNAANLFVSTGEFLSHGTNQISMFLTKPGMRFSDLFSNIKGAYEQNTAFKEKMMDLARLGADKPSYSEKGNASLLKAGSRILDGLSDVMRATASDAYDRLAAKAKEGGLAFEDTPAAKRDFVNQLGKYERRSQNGMVRCLRDSGVGPFATAGTNYVEQSVRSLGLDPGIRGSDLQSKLYLRANFLKNISIAAGSVAALNYVLWGRVDGDDKTPFGNIKYGESGGKTHSLDLTAPFLVKRGLRTTGLLSMIEGERGASPRATNFDKATEDVMHAFLHPTMGPAAQAALTMATGKNTIGMQVAEKAKEGESQKVKDVKAALLNVNPIVAAATGTARPNDKRPVVERFADLLGPLAPRVRQKPVGKR